ncbi:MAG: nucleoside/nucleotide kinase family protein [Oscillospiraceae bacterium]|nr:nucleoside/nucleotide kinase family protein [Oscillospiraceae bacterium]
MNYNIDVNGLPVRAQFTEENIGGIFLPLLRTLTDLQRRKGRRVLAMLAPPGAGKTTLAHFLRELSLSDPTLCPLTVIGMDGFHRRQEYLLTHTTERDGRQIPMVRVKGAPETFDLECLRERIRQVADGEACAWPEYDRLLHDPVEGALRVVGDLVLLEGNYLLLDEDGWRDLHQFADYTVRILADREALRDRLVARKAASGMPCEEAEQFVEFSDLANADLCLSRSLPADLTLVLQPDSSFVVQK